MDEVSAGHSNPSSINTFFGCFSHSLPFAARSHLPNKLPTLDPFLGSFFQGNPDQSPRWELVHPANHSPASWQKGGEKGGGDHKLEESNGV